MMNIERLSPADDFRYLPDVPLPPYSYVTGRFPHPVRDPAGHSFGLVHPPCPLPESSGWRECRPYLHGVDLFNHGYYWEAHEAWEAAWHACGRAGTSADFFKGLIKLAAAGVKAREGRHDGVRAHARRAAELFGKVAEAFPVGESRYFGLPVARLIDAAQGVADGSIVPAPATNAPVEVVFAIRLLPE